MALRLSGLQNQMVMIFVGPVSLRHRAFSTLSAGCLLPLKNSVIVTEQLF
jgi:hypothetical protein